LLEEIAEQFLLGGLYVRSHIYYPRNGSGSLHSIARYEAETFFHCSAVHQNGEFINGVKWLNIL
jgi:hypothetical protein